MVLTPEEDFYGAATYANKVALLVIFLCIVPFVAVVVALMSHYCLSVRSLSHFLLQLISIQVPTREISSLMNQAAANFVFGTRTRALSWIREIFLIQTTFDTMSAGLRSFSKFAPVITVRALLRSNVEAVLGVDDIDATAFFSDIEGKKEARP